MKIKSIKSFTPLFFLFVLIIASCSQPDIPEEELPPPPIEEVHSRTGRWTNIQDASDFITFTDDTTFIDEEGKRWNIDENEKKYYISLNSKKDIDFDQFNCVYLEGKGFYHKDDSPIIDDTNSTLRGGLWKLYENRFYFFHPGNDRYYSFDYIDDSFSEQGTYSINSGYLRLTPENGEEYNFQIKKSYGKSIIGNIVISPVNGKYSSIAKYAGTYGHQGYYMNATLDEYGFGKLGDVNGFVYILPGNGSLATKGFENRFDSYNLLFNTRGISLKRGESAVGDTTIDKSFSGVWKLDNEEFKIDAEKSVAEHDGKTYYLRDDGNRLFLYDAEDYIMYYIFEKANDMLYCKEFLIGFRENDNAYGTISTAGIGYIKTGDWNSDIEAPDEPVDPPEEIRLEGTWESKEVYKAYVFYDDGSCLYPVGGKQEEGTWKLALDGTYHIYSKNGTIQANGRLNEISGELEIKSSLNHEDASFLKGEGQYPLDESIIGAWVLNSTSIYDFSPNGRYFGSGMMGEECWFKTAGNQYHLYDENGDRILTNAYSFMGTNIVIGSSTGEKYEYPAGYLAGQYVDAFAPDDYSITIDSSQNATIKLNQREYQCKTYPMIDDNTGDIILNLYFLEYGHNAGLLYTSVRFTKLDDDSMYTLGFPTSYPTLSTSRKVLLIDAAKKDLLHTSGNIYIDEQTKKEIKLGEDGSMLIPSGKYVSYVLVGGKIYYEDNSRYNVSSWSEGSMTFNGVEYIESETGILPEPEFTCDTMLLGTWHNTYASQHFVHYYFKDDGTMQIGNNVVYVNTEYRYTTSGNKLYMWVDGYFTSTYAIFDYSVSGGELMLNKASFTKCNEELAQIIQPSSIREIVGKYVFEFEEIDIVKMIEIDSDGNGTLLYDDHSMYKLKFTMEGGKLKTYLIRNNHSQDFSDYCFYTTKGLYYAGLLLTKST